MRDRGLEYREGGNPPVNAGMFLRGARIAWWPAGFRRPDQRDASLILAAYEDYGRVLQTAEVRAALEPES